MHAVTICVGRRESRKAPSVIPRPRNCTTIGRLSILMMLCASGPTVVVFQIVARDGRYALSFPVAEPEVSCFFVYRVSTVFSTIYSCKTPFLQHLEIMLSVSTSSKAHFQKAISASITTQPDASIVDTIDVSAGTKKKTFACPRPGCTNHYKQMSGLRYHLTHVSNTDICLVHHSILTFISRVIINNYRIS